MFEAQGEVFVSQLLASGCMEEVGKPFEGGGQFVRLCSELSFAEFHRSFDRLRGFVVAVSDSDFGKLLDGRNHVRVIGSVQFFGQGDQLLR